MEPITDAHAAYAERLLHMSALIVGAVHDEGPETVQKSIDQALILEAPPGVDPVTALVTLLAAQINTESTAVQRLGWLTDSEPLRARLGIPDHDATLDELDAKLDALLEPDVTISIVAVLKGDVGLLEIPLAHRLLTVKYLHRKGHTTAEIAQMLRCNFRTVARYRARYAEAATGSAA